MNLEQPTRTVTTPDGASFPSSNTVSPFDDNMKEDTPLTGDAADGSNIHRYIPSSVKTLFGSTVFLICIGIMSIIPIIQLIIGIHFKGQCTINQHIPTYLFVAGICGLILVLSFIMMSLTFLCFLTNSTALSIIASCGICFNAFLSSLLSIFLFIWFIIGCIWIFGAKKKFNIIIKIWQPIVILHFMNFHSGY